MEAWAKHAKSVILTCACFGGSNLRCCCTTNFYCAVGGADSLYISHRIRHSPEKILSFDEVKISDNITVTFYICPYFSTNSRGHLSYEYIDLKILKGLNNFFLGLGGRKSNCGCYYFQA